jgi:hypothetical protein
MNSSLLISYLVTVMARVLAPGPAADAEQSNRRASL